MRRMTWILPLGIVVMIVLIGFFNRLTKYEPDNAQPLDGVGTYVDNNALWRVISGDWVSVDTRWMLTLGREYSMTLISKNKIVAESALSFSYLCPEPSLPTEITVEIPQLCGIDGEIISLIHVAGTERDTLILELSRPNGETEKVTFQKVE